MQELKILTFNIRCSYDGDGINSFIHRSGFIIDKINGERPHIICFQEVTDKIRLFLNEALTDYIIVGHGREKNYDGEGISIAYRKDCMILHSLEHFWLSPTPFVPASRYEEQSRYPRICTVAGLKHVDCRTPIRVYGVHLDNISDKARALGMEQLLNKLSQDNAEVAYPFVLLGDFNSEPQGKAIERCNNSQAPKMVDVTTNEPTFHGFGKCARKIDYIFFDADTAQCVRNVQRWTEQRDGIYLSDHYPISCTVELE